MWKVVDKKRNERDSKGEEQGGMGKEVTSMASTADKLMVVAWQQQPHVVQDSSHTK